jgi:hypothetical protein
LIQERPNNFGVNFPRSLRTLSRGEARISSVSEQSGAHEFEIQEIGRGRRRVLGPHRFWVSRLGCGHSPDELRPVDDDVQALRGSCLFRGDYQEPLSVGVHRELHDDTVERDLASKQSPWNTMLKARPYLHVNAHDVVICAVEEFLAIGSPDRVGPATNRNLD